MYNFLSRPTLKKVQVLNLLHTEGRFISSIELAQEVELSEKTIIKIISELSEDLSSLKEPAYIKEIKYKQFKLEYEDYFSIKSIERFYLQNSITYRAFDMIFYNELNDINMFAIDNFISLASMYRYINKVKPMLKQFQLKYSSQDGVTLKGTETQFRYFFYLFYWNSCWGEAWPFTLVSRSEIQKLVKQLKLELPESVLYWLAVCITRAKMGFIIDANPVYNKFSKHHYHFEEFTSGFKYLLTKLTTLTEEEIEKETMFSFAFLECLYPYEKKDTSVSLMMNFAQHHNKEIFVQATLYWIEKFISYFSMELDVEEYSVLFVNLMNLHYFTLNFIGPSLLFKDDFYKRQLNSQDTTQVEIMDQFYNTLLENQIYNKIFRQRDFLIGRYHQLLKQSIDIVNREKVKIKIISMINDVPFLFKQIKRVFLHVEYCSRDEDAELIITDRIYLNISKEKKDIFVWETVPKRKDYDRLAAKLQTIYFNKKQKPNQLLLKTLLSEV